MRYTLDTLERDIRLALDQGNDGRWLTDAGEENALQLRDIILQKLEQALGQALAQADASVVERYGRPFAAARPLWSDRALPAGYIAMPADFLRPLRLRMSDWERPVTDFSPPAPPLLAMQRRSTPPGLRANPANPMAYEGNVGSATVIRFLGCRTTGATVAELSYVALPEVTRAEDAVGAEVEIPRRLYHSVVQMAASLVAQAVGESAPANNT